jgi:uncharacterized repeat protein (TIGR03943 family)
MSHTFTESSRPSAGLKSLARRFVPALVLLEWGGILTYFFFSNRIAALLHPSFRPLVLVTGLLLLLSAGCIAWFEDAKSGGTEEEACGVDCEHAHGKLTAGGLLAFLVLFLPIALAARISPDAYGAVLMKNRGLRIDSQTAIDSRLPVSGQGRDASASLLPHDATPPLAVEVGDLLLAAQQPGSMPRYDGKRVELDGQFFPSGANSFELVRMLILCCAADAQPLAVRVETSQKLPSSDVAWTRVVGTVSFAKKGDAQVPIVTAEKIIPIPQPADPNIYHGGSRPIQHRGGTVKFQLPPR